MRPYGKEVNTLSRNNRIVERRTNRKAARQEGKRQIAHDVKVMDKEPIINLQEDARERDIMEYYDYHDESVGIRGIDFDLGYVSPYPSFTILACDGYYELAHSTIGGLYKNSPTWVD